MDNIHPPAGYVSVSPLEQWHKLLLEPTHIELRSTRHHWCTIITKPPPQKGTFLFPRAVMEVL